MTTELSFEQTLLENAPDREDSRFNNKPVVYTTFSDGVSRPAGDIAEDAFKAMVENNDNLYHTRRTIGRIEQSELGSYYIRCLDKATVYGYMTRSANYMRLSPNLKTGETNMKFIAPQKSYAEDILSYQTYECLPMLTGIYHHPILTKDGEIDFSLGYNKNSGVFIPPESYFEIEDMSVEKAMYTLLDLVNDFDFKDDESLFTALSLPLTLICRQYIDSSTPIFGFSGDSGAGKSLLVRTLHKLVTGHGVNERQAPHSQAEWNKTMLASLLSGDELIYFDNVNRRNNYGEDVTLESNALASAVTSGMFTDRVLGFSEQQTIPVNCTFAISGISVNTLLSEELFRRMLFINVEKTNKTINDYQYPILEDYVLENRPLLMSAYLALIQHWINNGKPNGTIQIQSFEKWSAIVSGIWEIAGVQNCFKGIAILDSFEQVYKQYLTDCYRATENGVISVQSVKDGFGHWTAQNAILDRYKDENISSEKQNLWVRQTFGNIDVAKVSDGSGNRPYSYKGISGIV